MKKEREERSAMFVWHKKSVSTLPTSSTRPDDSSDTLVCSINTWPSEKERERERAREREKEREAERERERGREREQ